MVLPIFKNKFAHGNEFYDKKKKWVFTSLLNIVYIPFFHTMKSRTSLAL